MSIVSPILAFQHVTMDVGNHSTGVRNVAVNLGNDGAGSHDVVTDVGNGSIHTPRQRRQ